MLLLSRRGLAHSLRCGLPTRIQPPAPCSSSSSSTTSSLLLNRPPSSFSPPTPSTTTTPHSALLRRPPCSFSITTPRIPNRAYTSRGSRPPPRRSGGGGGLSPEQLQAIMRIAGRLLGSLAHTIRTRGLHKSKPMLVAGLLLIPTGIGGVFVVSHLESAPLTGRRQLVFLDTAQEMELGAMAASQVYKEEKEHILPASAPETVMVHDISVALLKSLQQQIQGQGEDAVRLRDRIADMQWEVSVIDSDVVNAFVVPSGSIFVYTGLLEQVQTSGALAFILGHEISHALARHSVEKMGILCVGSFFVDFCAGFLGSSTHHYLQYMLLPYLQALVLNLPFSRSLETEADVLGVQLMATAGYDPQEAVEAWKRMEQGEKGGGGGGGGGKVMEFVSTHPSHHTRIERLTALVPEARALQQQSIRDKQRRGERVPDSKQSIVPSSSTRGRSKEVEALRQRRREESAQTALRASSLIPPALPE